ncbi:MAG: hypothetical protein ACHREM_28690 [Polyangiales bacterium]
MSAKPRRGSTRLRAVVVDATTTTTATATATTDRSDPLRRTLKSLETLARKLGVKVRYEAIVLPGREANDGSSRSGEASVGRGGLVRLYGAPVIVCDVGLPIVDKVSVLAEALARFDVQTISLSPIVRSRLRARRVP